MRVAIDVAFAQAHKFNQFDNTFIALFVGADVMNIHRLANDLTNSHTRIQRRIRVLENHLNVFTLFTKSVAAGF
ncbi:hypothetical protein D3C87_1676540 [compost metagenome]